MSFVWESKAGVKQLFAEVRKIIQLCLSKI